MRDKCILTIVLLLWLVDARPKDKDPKTNVDPSSNNLTEAAAPTARKPWAPRTRTTLDPLVNPRDEHHYRPHYGYEPYWPGGNSIIRDPYRDLGPNQTTPKIPLVCLDECEYIYLPIKHVCAHREDHYNFYSCANSRCKKGTYPMINMTVRYKTFDTYCDFLNAQCKKKFHDRWVFLYLGKCNYKQEEYIKPVFNATQLMSRMTLYLGDLHRKYSKKTKKPRKG